MGSGWAEVDREMGKIIVHSERLPNLVGQGEKLRSETEALIRLIKGVRRQIDQGLKGRDPAREPTSC